MVQTTEKIVLKSKLKDVIRHYYVRKDVPLEETSNYITQAEYDALSTYAQDDYAPMTQGQLAVLSGLRPNAVSELIHLKQSTINKEQIARVAATLNLSSISDIVDFSIE